VALAVACGPRESSSSAGPGSGAPLADIDERMIVHLDLDRWRQGFAGSRMAKCWGDPVIQAWFQRHFDRLCALTRERFGLNLRGLAPLTQGECLLALTYDPMLPAQSRWAKATLAVRRPGRGDALHRALEESFTPAAWEDFRRRVFRRGDVLALSLGDPRATAELAVKFDRGLAGMGLPGRGEPFARVVGRGLDTQTEPGDVSRRAQTAMQRLGLLSPVDYTASAAFEGRPLTVERVTEIGESPTIPQRVLGPNRRFIRASDLPAGTVAALCVSTVPPAEIFDFALDYVVNGLPSDRRPAVHQRLAAFEQAIGMSLRDEVCAALGQEWTWVFGGATGLSVDAAVLVPVLDRQALKRFIRAVVGQANAQLIALSGAAPGTSVIQRVSMTAGGHGYELLVIPGIPFQLCHGFVDDRLVIATSVNEMNALCQSPGSGSTLADSPLWQRLAPEFHEPACVAWFADFARVGVTLNQTVLPMAVPDSPEAARVLQELRAIFPAFTDHLGLVKAAQQWVADPPQSRWRRSEISRRESRYVSETGGEIVLLGMLGVLVMTEQIRAADSRGVVFGAPAP
jgi:hypothetical protein